MRLQHLYCFFVSTVCRPIYDFWLYLMECVWKNRQTLHRKVQKNNLVAQTKSIRRSSRVVKFNRCNLLSYEYIFNPGKRFVNWRWSRSIHSTSCLPWGDRNWIILEQGVKHTQWKHAKVGQCLAIQNCVKLRWHIGLVRLRDYQPNMSWWL